MTQTIYLDCDDTLVRWLDEDGQPLDGQNPYGGGAQRWIGNYRLLYEIERLALVSTMEPLRWVVWSGGGKEYAYDWGQRLLPHIDHMAIAKDFTRPTERDIYVDDQPVDAVAARHFWPLAFTVGSADYALYRLRKASA